jgi:hypothetical protein
LATSWADKYFIRLKDSLWEASESLRSISMLAGKDEHMNDIIQIRGYANNRHLVAQSALKQANEPKEGV